MSGATEETARGRNRINDTVVLTAASADATSPATATYARGTAYKGFTQFQSISIIATIQGATGGALDVIVETSPDGTDWYEYVHFSQLAAAAAQTTVVASPNMTGTVLARGKNLTTTMVLAAGSVATGQWFDQMRVRYVAGASTTAGAVQDVRVVGLLNGK